MQPAAHTGGRVLALAALVLTAGCAAAIGPAVDDARLALRVKTAVINDPEVGVLPVEVRAAGGVVTLRGRVRSDADRQRLVALARGVSGVREVREALTVTDLAPDEVLRPPPEFPDDRSDRLWRLAGLGLSLTSTRPSPEGLGDSFSGGPILRLPDRRGLGPAIGFSWTELEIESGPGNEPGLGSLRMRPLMLGLAYGGRHGEVAWSASLVGGWSFNRVRAHRTEVGPWRAIAADNGAVWRPGASLWFDVTPRLGVNLFAGGLFANPRVTFASEDAVQTMRMRTNALILSAGLAYWLF